MYAVKGNITNSIDKTRTFAALYLRPNDERGGHFVYNINTMQRSSVFRVVGVNKKPIPFTDLVIDTINKQAKEESEGIELADINLKTTVNEYEECDDNSQSDFEDDDKSYETSNDSTLKGDNDMSMGTDHLEEDQQQHFNVQEVNDVDKDDANQEDKGVDDEVPVQEEEVDVPAVIEEKSSVPDDDDGSSVPEDGASLPDSARGDEPSDASVETVDENDDPVVEPQPMAEEPLSQDRRPPAVRKLDSNLWEFWKDSLIGSVIHEHCIGSVIRDFCSTEAISSTPQYSFAKGMKVFKEKRHASIVKELRKNLIGKNLIDMLPARSITHDMMKMSLSYLMFLKRNGLVKTRGCANSKPQQEFITKIESSSPCVKTHALFLSCIVDAVENR